MIIDTCPVPGCGFRSPERLPGVFQHVCEVHLGSTPDHELVVGAAVARAITMAGDGLSNFVKVILITQTVHDERTSSRLSVGDIETGVAELMVQPDAARHLGHLLIQTADAAEGIET
jgi:hypothetical protein